MRRPVASWSSRLRKYSCSSSARSASVKYPIEAVEAMHVPLDMRRRHLHQPKLDVEDQARQSQAADRRSEELCILLGRADQAFARRTGAGSGAGRDCRRSHAHGDCRRGRRWRRRRRPVTRPVAGVTGRKKRCGTAAREQVARIVPASQRMVPLPGSKNRMRLCLLLAIRVPSSLRQTSP